MPKTGEHLLGSTFYSLHYHVVFSTKQRRPLIHPAWRAQLHAYMGGTTHGLEGVPECVGGVDDHVHLLVSLKTTSIMADWVRELKKASSTWASEHHEPLFSWQDGYSVFTLSWTHVPDVRKYIENQESHHAKTSFMDELIRLFAKNGVKYDPKYLE